MATLIQNKDKSINISELKSFVAAKVKEQARLMDVNRPPKSKAAPKRAGEISVMFRLFGILVLGWRSSYQKKPGRGA